LPGFPNCSPRFEKGSGFGGEFGALAEFPLSELFFTGARMGYEWYHNEISTNEPFLYQSGNKAETGIIEHNLKTKFSNATANLYLGFRPLSSIILNAGFSAALPFSPKFSQREILKKPDEYGAFENGKRERNVYLNKALPDYLKPIVNARLAISAEFPLNENATIRLAPEIAYYFPLTTVIKSYDWRDASLRAGIALKFSKERVLPLFADISAAPIVERRIFQSCDSTYQKYSPEQVEFTPTVEAPAGISEWEFSMFRGDHIITKYSGADDLPEKFILDISQDSSTFNKLSGEYSYIFRVKDKQKKEAVAEKAIRFDEKIFALSSDIEAYGIDLKDNKKFQKKNIQLLRKISTNVRPLLNYVFFDKQTDTLAPRYNRITKNLTYSYNESSLKNIDDLAMYRQILNIIGRRLRFNPESKISLAGYVSALSEEHGKLELAKNRALSVKNYLCDVWGIESERILIEANKKTSGLPEKPSLPGEDQHFKESAEENQRVEFHVDNENAFLLDPVITTDTLNQAFPLTFVFKPKATVSADNYTWQLSVAQNEKHFAKFQGENNIKDSLIINLKDRESEMIDKGGNLAYDYTLIDEFGQKCQKTGEIAVELQKQDSAFYKYSLILFDYESFSIESKNAKIIKMISERLVSGSNIEINGFTDALGDSLKNIQLSKQRSLSTAKKILNDYNLKPDDSSSIEDFNTHVVIDKKFYTQLPNNTNIKDVKASVFGAGESYPLLYDNSTPEGRFYCRTVTVNLVNQQSDAK
jgi:outer membrane protein OmpA-like peptidoglycan-associated protein